MQVSKRQVGIGLGIAFIASVVSSGCSLVLDWSPDELPCLDRKCAEGYTCLVNRCVPDGSLLKTETCNETQQCSEDLICAPRLFTCLESCGQGSYYRSTSDCPSGEYCKPVPIESSDGSLLFEGVCVENECTVPEDCQETETCVEIKLTANACVPRCEITWSGTIYGDNCGSGPGVGDRYCQPLGPAGAQKLACLDTTDTAQGTGINCNPVINPCMRENACVNELCRMHCNPAIGQASNPRCLAGELCCSVDGDLFGYCTADGCGP